MIKSQEIKGSLTLGPPLYKQMEVFYGIFDESLVDYIQIGR